MWGAVGNLARPLVWFDCTAYKAHRVTPHLWLFWGPTRVRKKVSIKNIFEAMFIGTLSKRVSLKMRRIWQPQGWPNCRDSKEIVHCSVHQVRNRNRVCSIILVMQPRTYKPSAVSILTALNAWYTTQSTIPRCLCFPGSSKKCRHHLPSYPGGDGPILYTNLPLSWLYW